MQRIASCSCEQLSITLSGDPKMVIACHCLKCQKRTGSAFGVSTYFSDEQVISTSGESKSFEKINDSGNKTVRQFCPNCGSSVFWKVGIFEGHTGVALGAFADPDFPSPTISAWEQSKHNWITMPAGCIESINHIMMYCIVVLWSIRILLGHNPAIFGRSQNHPT